MATSTNPSYKVRVVSINESGTDNVTVTFAHVLEEGAQDGTATPSTNYTQSLSLFLSQADAAAYFPGQQYTLTLAPVS